MGAIYDPKLSNEWRQRLISVPASFRGVAFHIEQSSRNSGRRTVVHEYPKRKASVGPYAEDMGLQAIRFSITGYLIFSPGENSRFGPYVQQRERLRIALDGDDAGRLVHPVFCPGGMMVMCPQYNMTEMRERGGYTEFDMQFVQAGAPGNAFATQNTVSSINSNASSAGTQLASNLDRMPNTI